MKTLLVVIFLLSPAVWAQGHKRYTVGEVDALYRVAENRYLFGTSNLQGSMTSRSYKEVENLQAVAELVRTYMAAGITAKQVLEEDRRKGVTCFVIGEPEPNTALHMSKSVLDSTRLQIQLFKRMKSNLKHHQ